MKAWHPIVWLMAFAGLASAPTVHAATPAEHVRAAILEAAGAGAPDPVDAALAARRHPGGVTLDVALADDEEAPVADCLAGHPRPHGVSPADWQALAAWPGLCVRGDGEGRSARLQLIDLDGDGRLDLIRDTYLGGTGLFSQIELVRQRADGFAPPPVTPDAVDAHDTAVFSINGRGADQAFERVDLNGQVFVAYRDSVYAEDTITLARPFDPAAQEAVRVRYAMRHRVAPPADDARPPALDAAVNRALAALARRGDVSRACPPRAGDAPGPWHGAGHYTFEYAATVAVRHAGDCVEVAVVNMLNSYRPPGGRGCCMAWVHDRSGRQIAGIALVTERRVLRIDIVPADPSAGF
ncbi:hypothetical protein PQS31_04060 [Luteimonas sp BLCC-B24]|uniref:hypothetical protein n=1 Tax=Luteimonas sp. BLCC-B24 TaxID=3025317 RepID=UPI00234C7FE2|nr:hypothetical protein [Luteimonas sp. BLCC-B24]MDC7805996.1 hypothetical protein [Luteimonas sp. BLCC-B24]